MDAVTATMAYFDDNANAKSILALEWTEDECDAGFTKLESVYNWPGTKKGKKTLTEGK